MDKTMEVVIVLMVLMIGAVIMIALMTDQTGGFGDFANSTTDDAQCNLWTAQYERRVCSGSVQSGGSDLENKISEECDFTVSCQDGEVVRG